MLLKFLAAAIVGSGTAHVSKFCFEMVLRLISQGVCILHSELQTAPTDWVNSVLAIGLVAFLEGDQGKSGRFLIGALGGFGRVGGGRLPRNDDEANRVSVYRFDGRNGNLHAGDSKCLVGVVDNGNRTSGRDERAADLEQVASVAGQFWLQ